MNPRSTTTIKPTSKKSGVQPPSSVLTVTTVQPQPCPPAKGLLERIKWKQYDQLVTYVYTQWHTLKPLEQLIAGVMIDGNLTVEEAQALVFGANERQRIKHSLPMSPAAIIMGVPAPSSATEGPAATTKILLAPSIMKAVRRRASLARTTVGLTATTPLFYDPAAPAKPMATTELRDLAQTVFSRALGQPTSANAHLQVEDTPSPRVAEQQEFDLPSSGAGQKRDHPPADTPVNENHRAPAKVSGEASTPTVTA